jgi:hypothetical protein
MGDEWGKSVVTLQRLQNETPAFRRAALATARVGGATGFYLGKIGGRHLMATNHHVFTSAGNCASSLIRFPLQNISANCIEIFGSWPEIDLAIFSVQLSAAAEAELAVVGRNFAFDQDVYLGEPLLTIGFGVASNNARNMVANQDSDCKVFSQRDEYRLMADPDELNPGPYKAWSFANACDVSHGDSGSAMVDRVTGDVVGIIWTGRIPKISSVQSSDYLSSLLNTRSEVIWDQLSYAVPAVKMGVYLAAQAKRSDISPTLRDVLTDLLSAR